MKEQKNGQSRKQKNGQNYGRYFGVCASFHHSKACLCPHCDIRPEFGILMYCAKGKCPTYGSKEQENEIGNIFADTKNRENINLDESESANECLCEKCPIYKQFAMKGTHFCDL